MRDQLLYLQDIVSAIEHIDTFVSGMTLEEFQTDDKTASAVIRKLEIIGEAAKGIPPAIRGGNPDIPWKEMAGMNRLFSIGLKPKGDFPVVSSRV